MSTNAAFNMQQEEFADFFAAKVCLEDFETDAFQQAIEDIFAVVLSAADPTDLVEAIDEAFASEAYRLYLQKPRRDLGYRKRALTPSLDTMEARVRVFGREVAAKLYATDRTWMQAIQQILLSVEGESTPAEHVGTVDPYKFVTDANVPLEVRELMLRAWHGLIALMVLQSLLKREQNHPLAASLATVALGGARAIRRFLKLNDEPIHRAHEVRRAWVEETFQKAKSGDGFFSPCSAE